MLIILSPSKGPLGNPWIGCNVGSRAPRQPPDVPSFPTWYSTFSHASCFPPACLHDCEEAVGQAMYNLVPVESAPPGLKSRLWQAASPGSPNPRAG